MIPKIKNITFHSARSHLSRPIADATHSIDTIDFIVARIETDTGVTGEGYLLSFHYSPAAIRGALQDIAPRAVGLPINAVGTFAQAVYADSEYFGDVGINRWAQGIIDCAMWDAWGHHLGSPVHQLFGTYRDRVPVYGSGGWISYSIDELLAEVTDYVGRGFTAVKIKVGSPELETDRERLHKVREAVGPNVAIMMDANQGCGMGRASELAAIGRSLGIHWFEEPLNHKDFDGYAHLRQHAGMQIAMGEREYDTTALTELIRRGGIDLWQPDLLRLGSVTAWRDSAAIAHAHNIPVLPHYYKEYDVPLLCTVENIYGSESFDWVDALIDNPLRIEGGYAYPSDKPGWGFRFKDDCLEDM